MINKKKRFQSNLCDYKTTNFEKMYKIVNNIFKNIGIIKIYYNVNI